jgi:hypothetical protein
LGRGPSACVRVESGQAPDQAIDPAIKRSVFFWPWFPSFALVLVCICTISALVFFSLKHPLLVFPDQGLYLHMAKLLLQGRVPYVDMFDNNPPLAIYLETIPIAAAQAFHLTEPLAFNLYICGLITLSFLLSSFILFKSGNRGAFHAGLVALTGFVFFNQFEVVDFGQREHIFCILYLPFFLLRYLRWLGDKPISKATAITAGLLAGVGIALKHYFLLIALAPELIWCIESRLSARSLKPMLAPESFAAASAVALYLLHFLFLPKAELEAYFGLIVPIYSAGYKFYVTSFSYNFNTWWRKDFYIMLLTTCGALFLAGRSSLVMPLQAFSLMSALVFVLAGQFWSYHVIPVRMCNYMSGMLQLFLLIDYLPVWVKANRFSPMFGCLVLLLTCGQITLSNYEPELKQIGPHDEFFMSQIGYLGDSPEADIDPLSRLVVDRTDKDDSILFISTSMSPGYPVYLQTGRKPASRLLHAMIIPVLQYVIDKPDELRKPFFKDKMRQFLDMYGEDIRKNHPKMIFIQFPLMSDLLERRDFFNKEMIDYKLLETRGETKIYIRENN